MRNAGIAILLLVLMTAGVLAGDLNYVSSDLWYSFNDVVNYGNYTYCVADAGLMIFDTVNRANPTYESKLYLGGQGNAVFYANSVAPTRRRRRLLPAMWLTRPPCAAPARPSRPRWATSAFW